MTTQGKATSFPSLFSSPGNEVKEKRTILSKRKQTMYLPKDRLFRVLTQGTSLIANILRLQKEKKKRFAVI